MSESKRIDDLQISQALESIRRELQIYIRRIVLRDAVAEELVQEVAIKAIEAADRAPRNEQELRPWLYRIGTNLAIDARRRRSFTRENLISDLRGMAMADEEYTSRARTLIGTPETKAVAKEHLLFCFRCTLQSLNEDQAAALLLKEMNGMSVSEISTILNLNESQSKNRLQEARRILRNKYKNTCSLIEQKGVCHQCIELDQFFEAHEGNPLKNTDGSLNSRLHVIREHESTPLGPWTKMLEGLLMSI